MKLAEFDAEMERYGYSDRDAQRMRRRLDERHKREARRTRIDLLLEGVTAIESVYRDVLAAPAPALNTDRPTPRGVGARRGGGARCVPRGAGGVHDQREGNRPPDARCSSPFHRPSADSASGTLSGSVPG